MRLTSSPFIDNGMVGYELMLDHKPEMKVTVELRIIDEDNVRISIKGGPGDGELVPIADIAFMAEPAHEVAPATQPID